MSKEEEKESKRLIQAQDVPSCEFLVEGIKDERQAIEMYIEEAYKTEDPLVSEIFHNIAKQEMEHLELLETMKKKKRC